MQQLNYHYQIKQVDFRILGILCVLYLQGQHLESLFAFLSRVAAVKSSRASAWCVLFCFSFSGASFYVLYSFLFSLDSLRS